METEQLVQSKYDITSHKLQQKKKSLFLTHGSVLYNISKIAQNRSGGKYRKITLKGEENRLISLYKLTIHQKTFYFFILLRYAIWTKSTSLIPNMNPFFHITYPFRVTGLPNGK